MVSGLVVSPVSVVVLSFVAVDVALACWVWASFRNGDEYCCLFCGRRFVFRSVFFSACAAAAAAAVVISFSRSTTEVRRSTASLSRPTSFFTKLFHNLCRRDQPTVHLSNCRYEDSLRAVCSVFFCRCVEISV